MTFLSILTLLATPGCIELPEVVEPNCEVRSAFYPDADGDGVGEPTAVFIGCEAPDGWVTKAASTTPPDTGTPLPTGDTAIGATGDTGTGPTGGTGLGPTGDTATMGPTATTGATATTGVTGSTATTADTGSTTTTGSTADTGVAGSTADTGPG